MQYCKVLGCNRNLVVGNDVVCLIYCTDVNVHMCRTFNIGTDVIMPVLLH